MSLTHDIQPKQMHSDSQPFLVKRYVADQKSAWDSFVRMAKNATFLFCRDYMDYHNDRYIDHSLMLFRGAKLVALLPANLAADGTVVSHEGLTYGGLVVSRFATLREILNYFHHFLQHLNKNQTSTVLYKQIPGFYNTLPDDEVTYALFLLNAQLCRCDCALVVNQADRLRMRKGRKSGISKARRFGVRVDQETSFAPFWEGVLIPQLARRYHVAPVHTVDEISLLAARFPTQIKQFSAYCGGEIVAGTTIYETPSIAYLQYCAISDKGRKIAALDYLLNWLIGERYKTKRYFDFGTCNEDNGRALNHGLLGWKEGFGARCYAHNFYRISTENYVKLETALYDRSDSARSLPVEIA